MFTVLNNFVNEHLLALRILMIFAGIGMIADGIGSAISFIRDAIRHNTTGQTIKFEEPQS